jgi:enoyl-CoA hydratase
MTQATILREVADGALILTLNKPEKLNALDWEMIDALLGAIDEAGRDPAISSVIIRGAGRCFCAGMDLSSVVASDPGARHATPHDDTFGMQRAAANWRRLWQSRKPVIVAVHGYCLGSPVEIVLHADLAIAADDASFGYPPVRGSGLPDTQMFVYRIGDQWTKRLLLTGDSIDAATAEKIGLVLKTVPRAALDDEARALARSIAQVPLPLLEAGKNVVNHAVELMGYSALQRQNWNEMAMARATPEMQEFSRIAREQGLKAALAWRDAKSARSRGKS